MKAELKKRLADLQRDLEKMGDVDDETRTSLRKLAAELEPLVAEPAEESIADDLLERWNAALHEFESDHPVLARAVSRISHVLAQMGF